ncbi:hypothetical protein GPALN_005924 [Globodera pallida]|nr:hypothetical protein GPALN_005924 [Globodera pallida]
MEMAVRQIGMKLYAFVLIVLAISALSAICKAGKKEEEAVKDEEHPIEKEYEEMKEKMRKKLEKKAQHDYTTSHVQAPYSYPSDTHDYTTSYVQAPYSYPSDTHDYTTSHVQAPYSYPSDTHDYTTSYVQEPYSYPSYTHDYTTSYVQEPYSNPSYTGAIVNAQQNVAAQDAHLGQQHNADGTRPLHVDDYKPWG